MTTNQDKIDRALKDADRPDDPAAEGPLEPDLPPDRTKQFTHTSLSRMRTGWEGEDPMAIEIVRAKAHEIVQEKLAVAFAIIRRIDKKVRTPVLVRDENGHQTGEIATLPDGSLLWELDEDGVPVERWSNIDDRFRRDILGSIARWLWEWQMVSADEWAEAMFAKVSWEETFAHGFNVISSAKVSGKPTIDDRTQWGHQHSVRERYFAVFKAYVSRLIDGQINVMKMLARVIEGTEIRLQGSLTRPGQSSPGRLFIPPPSMLYHRARDRCPGNISGLVRGGAR